MARKKQGYNARLDESMGGRSGKKSQSEKSRRDESTGMESSMGRRKYAAVGTMDRGMQMGGMAGGLPEEIRPDLGGVEDQISQLDEVSISGTLPPFYENEQGQFRAMPRMVHPETGMTNIGDVGSKNWYGRGGGMPRGYRKGGMATMPSSNTTVRGPHGSKATSKNTNMHKLNAMGKLKGQ